MSLIAKEPVNTFEITPQGTHIGFCMWVVDLGVQQVEWQGEVKQQHKIYIGFELPNEKMQDGRPFMCGCKYTLSLSDKSKLRGHLEGWRGRAFTGQELAGFDLANILGKPCMISIVHETANNGNTYANISSIAAPMKGMELPQPINPTIFFSLTDPDQGEFQKLPEWLRKMIDLGDVKQSENPAEGMDDFDDTIPF